MMRVARTILARARRGTRLLGDSSIIPTLDVNKNLKLRGICIDINVLIGDGFDISPEGDVKSLLKDKEASYLASRESKAREENRTKNIYDLKDEIAGVSDIQTKYMRKISMKTGGGGIEGLVNAMDSAANRGGSNRGDATILRESKLNPINSTAQIAQPSKWLIQYGFGDILDYANQRSMILVLIARCTTPPRVVETLLSQLPGTRLHVVVEDSGGDNASIESQLKECLQLQMGMRASEILVVSALDRHLAAGSNSNYYTCRFRGVDALYSSAAHTHYTASSSIEIQDIIDELNKVSFRSAAFSFRQY